MKSLRKCAGISWITVILVFYILFLSHTALSAEQAIFKLILNEQDKGEFFFILEPEGDIWMARSDFEQLGLKEGLGRDILINGVTHVSLVSIPGFEFRINVETVCLEVKASPSLFREHDVDISYSKPYKVVFSKDSSAFLNYSIDYDHRSDQPFFDISGEVGISTVNYLGLTTFIYQKEEDTEEAVRLMTNITYNDRDTLKTVTFGDFSASSGPLGSISLIGGVSYSKNFSIDPFFLKPPPLKLSGILDTPSDLEVYLDGLLVRREKLSPGEFTFNDVPATTGFGNAKMIIKDVYGREKTFTTPYYYSDHLLRKGLHEYRYSAGFMRNDFGEKSFSYGKPALLGYHNIGLSEYLKIGYAAEASNNSISIGPSFSYLAFNKGVIDVAVAGSNNSGKSGLSGMLNYSYQSRGLNMRLFFRSDSREYSNLTMKPSDDKAKFQFSGVIGVGGKKTGFLTAEYSYAELYKSNQLSRVVLAYSKAISERASFFITATEIKDTETRDEIFFGIHIYFGNKFSGSVNHTQGNSSTTQKISFQKNPPVGNGTGFRTEMVNTGDKDHINGNLTYQNDYGLYEFDVTGNDRDMGYRLSFSGGIGYIDKSFFLSRPITDSYAKVKVGKLEDVRVYYYGNESGRTDKNGELFVTNLRSFHDNKISIESQDIPINYSITTLSQYVSPLLRSGSVVEFQLNKLQAITGNLFIIKNGAEIPVQFGRLYVQVKDSTQEGLIGRQGEFYLENIPRGMHPAKIVLKGDECVFDMIIPDSNEIFLNLGNIICENKK